MRSQSQPPEPSGQGSSEIFKALVRSVAVSLEVFLHGQMGCRYIDCGIAAILVLVVFRNIFPPAEGAPLHWFTLVYSAVWICKFPVSVYRRHRGGMRIHSMYCGRPHLWRLLPNWREEYVKHVEALGIIGLGFGVRCLNRPLGDYLVFAACLLLIRSVALAYSLHHRAMDLHDGVLEQRSIAELFEQINRQ